MIFVTVGAQMPFDRLVLAVDAWAAVHGARDVFAQIGPGGREPPHLEWTRFIEPDEFRRRMTESDAVVSHAGMGTILTALEFGKPIVVMPRRGDLHETRNDHQVATAETFEKLGRVHVAHDEPELARWLDHVTELRPVELIAHSASPKLIGALREVVADVARHAHEGRGP
jgi:UDP-N-acetylglucosamine transferase subunit ALG13